MTRPMQQRVHVDAVVERVRFHNANTRYIVIIVRVEGQRTAFVGDFNVEPEKGAKVSAIGRWVDDRKHGRQFRFDSLEVHAPTSRDQVIARLMTYPGIGEAMAERIVQQFGDRTWEILDERINVMRNVPGIGPKAFERIRQHHHKQHGPIEKLKARLVDVGAPPSLAKRIHEAYGDRSIEMINDHPYRVSAKVERFGFVIAERCARATGIDPENGERVEAGVIHALRQQRMNGHTCCSWNTLTDAAGQMLDIRPDPIDEAVDRLLDRKALRYEHNMVFLSGAAHVEERVARHIDALTRPVRVVWSSIDLPDHLSPGQRDAVESVARSGVTVLTGGPGTGKSTAVSTVIELADRAGVDVILCAPTGRAAKRLSEATGRSASTIHRLLRPVHGSSDFHHGEAQPLPPGLVVVDEVSMVDIELADSLLSALTTDHRLLLVGDADQLPSVGYGNVLADIIDASERGANISLVRLEQIFRQEDGSTIVANAHRILAGEKLRSDPPSRGAAGQFYMLAAESDAQAKVAALASVRIPHAYGFDPKTEVQVLCPVHAGPVGTQAFNAELQRRYSVRGQDAFYAGQTRYFVGDRVMQTRNDYERNVFNGDLGTVVRFDDKNVEIDFDGAIKVYSRFDLANIKLAYAMTIHKSQGGEFPAVIVPVMRGGRPISRSLLYTAITRARSLCILVGHIDAMQQAVHTDSTRRCTRLSERLTTRN